MSTLGVPDNGTPQRVSISMSIDPLSATPHSDAARGASDALSSRPAGVDYAVLDPLKVAAQRAALAKARPGIPYDAGHQAAVEALTEGLLRLGLLKGKLEKAIADGAYRRFYRHKTGHWLGLDVHDVGEHRLDGESRLLEPGMVFTIEPGLYVAPDDKSVPAKWRGIGIRTEDDVLITADRHRILTDALVRDADEIEAFMAE